MSADRCPGIGREPHDAYPVIEIRSPIRLTVCTDCFRHLITRKGRP